MSDPGTLQLLATGLNFVPALLWTVVAADLWCFLRKRQSRGAVFLILFVLACLVAVHFSLWTLWMMIPLHLGSPSPLRERAGQDVRGLRPEGAAGRAAALRRGRGRAGELAARPGARRLHVPAPGLLRAGTRAARLQPLPRAVGHRFTDGREELPQTAGRALPRRDEADRAVDETNGEIGIAGGDVERPARKLTVDLAAVVRPEELAERLTDGARLGRVLVGCTVTQLCETIEDEPALEPAAVGQLVLVLLEVGGVDEVANQLE